MKIRTSPLRSQIRFAVALTLAAVAPFHVETSRAFARPTDEEPLGARFRRGDVDADGSVNLADSIATLGALFVGDVEIGCEDAADANDDGSVDLADAAFALSYLFGGGADLPYPGADRCGVDPTGDDSLDCLSPEACSVRTRKENGNVLAMQISPKQDPSLVFEVQSSVTIVRNARDLLIALERAFEGMVIYLPDDATIDLTPYPDAFGIPAGVTLRGSRGGLNEGGLIFSENEEKKFLFDVRGHDVVIEGLRFRGPSSGKSRSLGKVGAILARDSYRTTIINNEFYNWPHVGVFVADRLPKEGEPDYYDPEQCVGAEPDRLHMVKIERNFFHHNQREGNGYGVKSSSGAFPFFLKNTFNHNRHAVAADGRARTSYRAHLNLVLSGGGKYCKVGDRICTYEHHFDMHGRGNGEDGSWTGGIAGQFMDIAYNTILGDQTYFGKTRAALDVRGIPCDHVAFHHNVLAHGDADEAVRDFVDDLVRERIVKGDTVAEIRALVREIDRVYVYDNTYDADSLGPFGVGDFDGDGVDDLMIATGAAWYYSSGARTEWRFLKKSVKRLDQLLLADFDGNGKTDVFTKSGNNWRVAHDGVGGWTTINSSGTAQSGYRVGDFDGDGEADIFRAGGGAWKVSWSGTSRWEVTATSAHGVEDLRFGDFDGDGRTDVFSLASGQWSVSWSGSSRWARLNDRLSSDLNSLVFADFDGDGTTDVARQSGSHWQVSRAGRTRWQTLNTVGNGIENQLVLQVIGNFDGRSGADALRTRAFLGRAAKRFDLSSGAARSFVEHSRYDMR